MIVVSRSSLLIAHFLFRHLRNTLRSFQLHTGVGGMVRDYRNQQAMVWAIEVLVGGIPLARWPQNSFSRYFGDARCRINGEFAFYEFAPFVPKSVDLFYWKAKLITGFSVSELVAISALTAVTDMYFSL